MNSKLQMTLIRTGSAALLLPLYFYFILTDNLNSLLLLLTSLVVSVICLYEFYQVVGNNREEKPFILPGMICGFILNLLMYFYAFGKIYGYSKYIEIYDVRPVIAVFMILLIIIFLIQIFKRPLKGGIYSLSVTIMGVIFIPLSFSHIILMKALPDSMYYLILIHLVVMINDSAAYLGGVLFGRHKVGFEVSPNKSWEGYFSGVFFSIITVIVYNEILITFFSKKLFSTLEATLIGIVLALLGSTGDLAESAIKRDANIKDSGKIIPGHGGMWDVFDALIFTFPLFYYYLKIRGI